MKKRMNLIFGWLLVCLFAISSTVVYAAEALTADKFEDKMKDLDYSTVQYGTSVYASSSEHDETFVFTVAESEEEAKEAIDETYEEAEDYEDLKRSKTTSGNKSCVTISGKEDGEYGFVMACSIDDTLVMAMTSDEDRVSTVKDVMKELGYYSGSNIVLYVVIGVVVAIGVVAVIYFLTKKKGNNNMNNGGMYYGQPQPMNQGMNFGQPQQPTNQGMDFGQPQQPMNQGMNFGQPQQPMNQGMDFGQPQPMNQGMNFGQPQQPMNQNNNFNQPNNGQF